MSDIFDPIDYGQEEQKQLVGRIPLNREAPWFKKYWRPAMAWQYFAVCLFDFIIAPSAILWYSHSLGQEYISWEPLTLRAGGFYHIAMGAILSITSWSRGQEKINRVD